MSDRSLAALNAHLQATVDRLLTERERHLRRVDESFARRHNAQRDEIDMLRKRLAKCTCQTKETT